MLAMPIHDVQKQYWSEMIKLKAGELYIRYYRDNLGSWVTTAATFRAIASSVSIASWAIWHSLAFVWAAIIAASQVGDALKNVFPVAKKHKSAGELASTLEMLFIDAQLEWENVSSGKYTNDDINARLHKLRTLQKQAEHRSFPNGLAVRAGLEARAKEDTKVFFYETYGV